jgi:hypothetical protein
MNILEDKDTCMNCGKEIAPWYKVCSPACAGAIGGRNGHTGGFYANRELAREAGRRGGKISRRGKSEKALEQQ